MTKYKEGDEFLSSLAELEKKVILALKDDGITNLSICITICQTLEELRENQKLREVLFRGIIASDNKESN